MIIMETKKILKGRNKHRSTFAMMFYINKTKIKKDGLCQLLCRVTIDTDAAQIGTKIAVDPSVLGWQIRPCYRQK